MTMKTETLSRYAVGKAIETLPLEAQKRKLATRLAEMLGTDGRVKVARLHAEMFPLVTTNSANNALRKLLRAIDEAAKAANSQLRACITDSKKGGAEQRWVWFEGIALADPEPAAEDLAGLDPDSLIDPPGRLLTAPVVLVTCNHTETAAVRERFAPDAEPVSKEGLDHYRLGRHGGVEVILVVSRQGERQAQAAAEQIQQAFRPRAMIAVGIAFGLDQGTQRLGDVLVSEWICDYELKKVAASGEVIQRGIPLTATPALVDRFHALDHHKSSGRGKGIDWPTLHFGGLLSGSTLVDNLDHRESLKKLSPGNVKGGEMEAAGLGTVAIRGGIDWIVVKAISDWADGKKNHATAEADQRQAAQNAAFVVFEAIRSGRWPPGRDDSPRPESPVPWLKDLNDLPARIDDPGGARMSLAKHDAPVDTWETSSRNDACQTVLDWVRQRDGARLFILLGEYGMGKTVLCQRLAQELLTRRSTDPSWPVPLYFDLKHLTGIRGRVPTVGEVMTECAQAGWLHQGDLSQCSVEAIRRWIDAGALVVFDGLDEALVKMNQADGAEFTRRLLSLVSPGPAATAGAGPRVLISSRTQYFRTLRAERNHFLGEDRAGRRPASFEAILLLPFTDTQVRTYLGAVLPTTEADRALEVIKSVHDLGQLAHRPYTLKLIAEQIPELERLRFEGRPVYGVTLYRQMAADWFDRDGGKHHINRREDKMALVAALAAYLWTKHGNRPGPAGASPQSAVGLPPKMIENWLHEWLEDDPALRRRYGHLDPDLLEEDLRNTSFLRRVDLDDDTSRFVFAHTSLQEFFLSEFLLAGIRTDRPERWSMACPSPETLDFLGQSLAEAHDQTALLGQLERWLTGTDTAVNRVIFDYTRRALSQDYPAPSLRGINLQGADLTDLRLDPAGIDMTDANLSQADLTDARLVNCVLNGAKLTTARFNRAILINCSLKNADLARASLVGTVLRHCDLSTARAPGAQQLETHWLHCNGLPSSLVADPTALVVPPIASSGTLDPTTARLRRTGHASSVSVANWSPDGATLATGDRNGRIGLWDPRTGQTTLQLQGHDSEVKGVAWSPDGRTLAANHEDGWVSLWDTRTGQATLELPSRFRAALAWSPDGRTLATGDLDGRVSLWDTHTGETALELPGHGFIAVRMAWSPDGRTLTIVDMDARVSLWDTRTGQATLEPLGHKSGATRVAWPPNGGTFTTRSSGRQVEMWRERTSGAPLELSCRGLGVMGVAWSPDGRTLASSDQDGQVRLWDTHTGKTKLKLPGHGSTVMQMAWSPDGRTLATSDLHARIRLWDTRTGKTTLKLPGRWLIVRGVAWSPDGQTLGTSGQDGQIRLWDTRTGKTTLELLRHGSGVAGVAWSPDGRTLATCDRDALIRLWDTRTGKTTLQLPCQRSDVIDLAWSPDGRTLATGHQDGHVTFWDTRTGKTTLKLPCQRSDVTDLAWSPDGRTLATGHQDGHVTFWDARAGKTTAESRSSSFGTTVVAWSPDAQALAASNTRGDVRLCDARTGQTTLELPRHGSHHLPAVGWSPEGRTLATADEEHGRVRLWDPRTGEVVAVFELLGESWASWDGDGNLVACDEGAWEHLAWYAPGDDDHPYGRAYPAEYFGPLPVVRPEPTPVPA
ncbi:MAG: pentapeptide repeat-containing protein [Bifidobacteriaceae bacterium]|jgi:WD40 repeat protein/nucleoside phosphorylase/uncharacterized protein YjbI with pentapeptide repeats|nr:pentapeptide repeat-containing protein [Bifidobacteriaceae bacterium]